MEVFLDAAGLGGRCVELVVGIHVTRKHGVAADAVFAQIDRHALGQTDDAGLGAPVSSVGLPRAVPVD